ncbi:MAG: excinuclease ABC subunit UvrA [Spirochaetota bacterium]|jgi:excinuclease ABC subunit A|nr:excinuclease ABC subunit UvrA [Spirochaetota bacterium]
MPNTIIVKGAREHNLKNISIEMPRDAFIVVTGLSGSGKSSLAFDTIYAEGQRRYVESLSSYARQFLGRMDKPDVDLLEGLSPAISIEQKTTHSNPRSTVGTVTEIYDYFRLLYARVGIPWCPVCGREITSQSLDQIVSDVLARNQGKILILAPIARGAKGEYRKEFAKILQEGFVRARVDGEVQEVTEGMSLRKTFKHTIEIVIDRLIISRENSARARLSESVETALKHGDGLVVIHDMDAKEDTTYSERHACAHCGFSVGEIEPRLFSFNNPFGACPECTGLGYRLEFDPDLIIPDRSLSLNEGAIRTISNMQGQWVSTQLAAIAEALKFSLDAPVEKLPEAVIEMLFYGSGEREFRYVFSGKNNRSRYEYTGKFEGLIPNLQRRYHETHSPGMREWMENFMREQPCTTCRGKRLKPEALAVQIARKNIIELSALDARAALEFFDTLALDARRSAIAKQIVKEIRERLSFLIDVGLDYLSLDRMAGTLSGGEAQRIRLATQIGSSLTGVLYVLDEPTIGLHQRDNARLLSTLRHLQSLGNTLIVVEHDEQTIRQADYLIDLGPGAGEHGGHVVFQGKPKDILAVESSLTGQYLARKLRIAVPKTRRAGNGQNLVIHQAAENNLKGITVAIPLGKMVVVTGVSGSGKSSLVNEVLYKGLARALGLSHEYPGKCRRIEGAENIDKVINIDQSPIGRTPRSNPATYTGLFTPIRDLFASLPEAKARGFAPGRFSFNVKGGRCETCEGAGLLCIEMHFLPDVYVTCDVCHGRRYNSETLEVRYKGMNIHEVLDMTIEEAGEFFAAFPVMQAKLQTLSDVGLGYVRLGQPATTLSGGEAQRVKLATYLSKRATGKTLYILDEPTTGLHFDDVRRLLGVLERFADAGDSVLVIEHNLDVIKRADWIIDLGPEGGNKGGELISAGTPEDIARCVASFTGQYLKPLLKLK